MIYRKIFLIFLSVVVMGCTDRAADLDWSTGTARAENYTLTQEVGLENGSPERSYDRSLTLDFSGSDEVVITNQGETSPPLPVSPGGHIVASGDEVPSLDIVIILHLLSKNGVPGASAGDSWETFFPTDAQLLDEPDKLSLQDRYRISVTDVREDQGRTMVDLTVRGDVRVVDNTWLSDGLVPGDVSAATSAGVAALQQWTPNINGAATFDASSNRLHSADISFLLVPRIGVGYDDILTSEHRRRVIVVAN